MRAIFLIAIVSALPSFASGPARDLRVGEGFVNPLGFHDPTPVFSWKLPEGTTAQNAYRIVAASNREHLADAPDLWDSGRVPSGQSTWVDYEGKPLASGSEVHWQVKFWDAEGNESPWSDPASFELGLLETAAWKGSWIRMHTGSADEKPANSVVIENALYGADGDAANSIDIGGTLRKLQAEGRGEVIANNQLAGRDPAYGTVKTLTISLVRDGVREVVKVGENQKFDLASGTIPKARPPYIPEYLRREFEVARPIRAARLHVTAKGVYELHLNGAKVGGDFMAPGWTPYSRKIEALTYDVTPMLREGSNAIGAILGEGWYAGRLGWGEHDGGRRSPELLVQLDVIYDDGSSETLRSDEEWKATHRGPIRFSGIYDGETYDARLEMPGWDKAGFDDSTWNPVVARKPSPHDRIAPKRHHPVRATKEIAAVKVTEPQPGRFVFDLGQNIVGWPKLTIPVRKDATITVRFAEMLEKDGTLYTANYRSAKSTNTYTAAADGVISWHPVFTFHGFRHVELSGLPDGAKPEPGWVTGTVLHSDFGWTGDFDSSHALLNQLQNNIAWGLRGNFLDVPTDCPQRDERLGWTGDAQVFAPAALFNADVHSFLASWLESMRLDQQEDGAIPNVVPNILDNHCGGPGWSDAATIIPWELYLRTGDINVLRENFDMMRRWVGWYEKEAKEGVVDVDAYGDWLQPYQKDPHNKGDTPRDLVGTAYFAYSAELASRTARRLGEDAEADRLAEVSARVKAAFARRFFDPSGKLTTPEETQTAYLLALAFDLLPEQMRDAAFRNLVRLLDEAGGHLRTGFLGTPLLAPTLDRFGRGDLAYAVLFKETYPSWFFSIHQGATTMWERWNSYSHAEGFGNAGMNSFNHYAYGAIGQWMYERIAGLAPDPARPGYKHIFIQPLPGGPLDRAAAALETPFGRARSAWTLDNGTLRLETTVPPNTTATLRLPAGENGAPVVKENGEPRDLRIEDGWALLELPAGGHSFAITGLDIARPDR